MAEEPVLPPSDRPVSLGPTAPFFLALFLFLLYSFCGSLAHEILYRTGLFGQVYGKEAVASALKPELQAAACATVLLHQDPLGAATACSIYFLKVQEQKELRGRLSLWSTTLGFLLWAALVALVFRLLPEFSPRAMGLTLERAGQNFHAG